MEHRQQQQEVYSAQQQQQEAHSASRQHLARHRHPRLGNRQRPGVLLARRRQRNRLHSGNRPYLAVQRRVAAHLGHLRRPLVVLSVHPLRSPLVHSALRLRALVVHLGHQLSHQRQVHSEVQRLRHPPQLHSAHKPHHHQTYLVHQHRHHSLPNNKRYGRVPTLSLARFQRMNRPWPCDNHGVIWMHMTLR